jgi:hypothetical protein
MASEPGGEISCRENNSHSMEKALSLTLAGFTKVLKENIGISV